MSIAFVDGNIFRVSEAVEIQNDILVGQNFFKMFSTTCRVWVRQKKAKLAETKADRKL